MPTPSDAAYWDAIYREGTPGWDKGRPSPPIVRMIGEKVIPAGSWVCVIGAGKGQEAIALAKAGYRVTAVDFAEEAVKGVRENAKAAGVELDVQQRDLFTLPTDFRATFHAILEHTCFCAIETTRRAEYVDVVHACLRENGILFGLFYAHGRNGGPPFTTDEAEVRKLFEPRFTVERLVKAPDSFPERANSELEFVFRRK